MEIKKKFLYVILITTAIILFTSVNSKAGSLNLNNLDFIARINSDGSMNVKEIWDISINDTNTLYKTFETDSSKYSGIDDVSVKEITDGQETYFIQDDAWSYNAPKNHYYGTENSDGDFEIGWGVSLENKSAIRQYEISYTVNDAITKYNDYAELYWQFVGRDFEVDANKITGTIYLPENVSNQDDIKVWGHTKALNGTIYATGIKNVIVSQKIGEEGSVIEKNGTINYLLGAYNNTGSNVSDYTITLNFTNEGAIETAWGKYYGGVPYLLKWDDDTDIVNPEFANVIIESDLSNMTYGNAIGVTFKGTYAPLSFEEEDKSILFVGAENKLYWPLAGAKIGAMRGYFEIDGTEAEIAEASAKQFILNFGDEDATSIETISTSVESESIYNLAGQKMSKMQKGINIVNGKKILK